MVAMDDDKMVDVKWECSQIRGRGVVREWMRDDSKRKDKYV